MPGRHQRGPGARPPAVRACRSHPDYVGLPEPVQTDIAGGTHLHFRRRDSTRKFFEHHKLQPGDQIAIEKLPDDEYRVVPVR
jgi:hypothetical protein